METSPALRRSRERAPAALFRDGCGIAAANLSSASFALLETYLALLEESWREAAFQDAPAPLATQANKF